jgi:acyl-CoA synthetase (NDP forming)
LQAELLAKVRSAGLRMVGPNCFGVLNTSEQVRLNATFSPVYPPAGGVAMASQSGALGLAILAAARRLQLGISQFVSVGNQADVTSTDLLEYWETDPGTQVVLLYSESFGEPRRFARLARRICRHKPIVAIKSGRSGAGARAAGSHTAALAASDVAVEALCDQTGIIRAEHLEEMFDLATALSMQPLPRGRRIGVITNAGGPAILCADACEAAGLTLPELSSGLQARLATLLPATASVRNPVDMIASSGAKEYRLVVEQVLRAGEVDALIVIYIPVGLSELQEVSAAVHEALAAALSHGATEVPVLAIWMSDEEPECRDWRGARQPSGDQPQEQSSIADAMSGAAGRRVPSYHYPEAAARVLGRLVKYAEWRAQPHGSPRHFADLDVVAVQRLCSRLLAEHGPGWLGAGDTRQLLQTAGFPILPGGLAHSPDSAATLAEAVGYPVAVKLASRQILHKTEAGGVQLNLRTAAEVRDAFQRIQSTLAATGRLSAMEGVLVQPMLSGGVELMIGMTQDRLFGPLLAFGLGGIHVEILKDVCFRITPLTEHDAAEMIRGIRGYRLLTGYRGHPPADVAAVEDLLLRLSALVEAVPALAELDFNPVIALPPGGGVRIVDARIRLT